MSEKKNKSADHPQQGRRRRRRRRGVPTALTIFLLVLALAAGAFGGFAVARMKTPNADREALAAANARIMELENTLTMLGFTPGVDDPASWTQGTAVPSNPLDDLSGSSAGADDGIWSEQNLLGGAIAEGGESVIVAEFDGGALYSDEVIPAYNDEMTARAFAGETVDAGAVLMDVLSYKASDKIISLRAKALGFDQLTEEDLSGITAEAQEIFDDQIAYYTAYVRKDGMSDEEAKQAAAEYLNGTAGISVESIAEDLKSTAWSKKFYEYTVKDIDVTDDEVQSHYDEMLADQQADFTTFPESYEYAHINGEIITYNPDGYRAVRDILIPFEDNADGVSAGRLLTRLFALDPANDAEEIASLTEQLNALYAPLEKKAQAALERLRAGESFDELMQQIGTSETLLSEPLRTEGFYVSVGSDVNSAEFVEGSMQLAQPGDVSQPLRSAAGLHIVEYIRPIAPGAVPLSEIRDAVRQDALEIKQANYYEQQLGLLLEASNVKFYPERLQ